MYLHLRNGFGQLRAQGSNSIIDVNPQLAVLVRTPA